ncbi:HPP family protein [Bordetella genomosp. 4]|uniref:HPP family protein n=1 Tax=Bordetella genomosp. 4 TaxID=463044 RepID=UPI000B9EEC9A|nr:HPP family protein [Bordetella genomosp. 4]OZI52647.1 hypothetical protein CAL21_03205 [Bordetella genomosp. 4]
MVAIKTSLYSWLMRFWPQPLHVHGRERIRACLGALLGLTVTGVVSSAFGHSGTHFMLIAPMGASAVLLFAVPSSPLAQPWSVIGGNLVASLVGVTAARWLPDPLMAASIAVSVSIALMFVLRCVHPPSGAVALTAVLGDSAVHSAGYAFVLEPVMLNSCVILICALFYHGITRHHYPHVLSRKDDEAAVEDEWAGFMRQDIEQILDERDELLSVDSEDIYQVLREAVSRAHERRTKSVRCSDVMVPAAATLRPATTMRQAWKVLKRLDVPGLPVADGAGRYQGMVTLVDLLLRARSSGRGGWALWPGAAGLGTPLRDVLSTDAPTVTPQTLLSVAAPKVLNSPAHCVPVIDGLGMLRGVVTPAQLVHDSYLDNLGLPLNSPSTESSVIRPTHIAI